ncbi:MAG TPA: cysteine desulfurase-like protein [Pyrinomonadaceae bacterium]|nr:cysteine desulfurase-like protein [Pyrinomonadaceae bacterium]
MEIPTAIQVEKPLVAPVSEIRNYFPALERLHEQYPVAYFDGPGGTQVPRPVVEAMVEYLYHHNANTHWAYPTSEETDAAIESAREACADFLNASPTEIAFGANMTTLTFHLARALAARFAPGDEIVVTELDHHANVAPWSRIANEWKLTVRTVKMVPESGQLDWNSFDRSVTKRTRLIAVGAASNALGTINDVARAIGVARSLGALAFVDAVHYVPHVLADVRALDCDFLGMSAYKFYGPHIGVLFGKRELFESMDFPKLIPAPDYAPENVETGTQNQEGMVGTGAAIDFLSFLGAGETRRAQLETVYDELHQRNAILTSRLWEGLRKIDGVRLYGPSPEIARTPTIAFTVRGVSSTDVARRLASKGLFLSHGDFYAATVIERLGLEPEGLVRAGCACYTSVEEIDRLIEGIREVADSH